MSLLGLLELQADTLFIHDEDGRTTLENSSERAPAPRLYLATCPEGTVIRVRADIDQSLARQLRDLAHVLPRSGMPHSQAVFDVLAQDSPGEFWPPWCIVFHDAEPASIAFAARLGAGAAEVGVATAPAFRGYGFAAAAAAAWAEHPELVGRSLFYSTSVANRSSRRVVDRLTLPFLGHTLRVT